MKIEWETFTFFGLATTVRNANTGIVDLGEVVFEVGADSLD